jgi:hypothetical protein
MVAEPANVAADQSAFQPVTDASGIAEILAEFGSDFAPSDQPTDTLVYDATTGQVVEQASPTEAEPDADPTEAVWQDEAVQTRHKRERTKYARDLTRLTEQHLDGDAEATKRLEATPEGRQQLRLLDKAKERISTTVSQQSQRDAYFQHLQTLQKESQYEFASLMADPEVAAFYSYEAAQRQQARTPETARQRPSEDIDARVEKFHTALQKQGKAAGLSADEMAALDPYNFDGEPEDVMAQMSAALSQATVAAQIRQITGPVAERAAQVNGVAQRARQAAQQGAPVIAGQGAGAPLTREQLQLAFIEASTNGTLTPQLERDYYAMERRHSPDSRWI